MLLNCAAAPCGPRLAIWSPRNRGRRGPKGRKLETFPRFQRRLHSSGAVSISNTQVSLSQETVHAKDWKQAALSIEFCLHSETAPGQEHVIIGSCSELGEWSIESALQLHWTDGHIWRGQLEIPVAAYPLEFKCVKLDSDGKVEWQAGDNQRLEMPSEKGVSDMSVICIWHDGNVTCEKESAKVKEDRHPEPSADECSENEDSEPDDAFGDQAQFNSIAQALQEEKAAHEQSAAVAEQERIRLVAELTNLQAAVSDAAAEVEERTAKALAGSQKEVEQLQSTLAREQSRAAARQAELDKAWHETSEAQDKLQQNDKELIELKAKLDISTYASKKAEQRCDDAETRLMAAEARLSSEQQELGTMRQEAASLAQRAADLDKQFQREHKTVQALRQELEEARNELKIALAKLRALQKVLEDRNQFITDLRMEMEQQRIKMVGELAQERARIIVLNRRCSEFKAQEDRMRIQRDALAAQLGTSGFSPNQILQDIDDDFAAKGRKKGKSMGPSCCEPPHGPIEDVASSAQGNPVHEAEYVKDNAANDRPLTLLQEDSSGNQVHDEEKQQHTNSTPAVLNQTDSNVALQKASDAQEEVEEASDAQEEVEEASDAPEEVEEASDAPEEVEEASNAPEARASASSPTDAFKVMERQDESLPCSPENHGTSVTAILHVQEDAEEPVTLLLNYIGVDGFQQHQDSETEQPAVVHDGERRQHGNSAALSSASLQTGRSVTVDNTPSAMQQSGAAASNSRSSSVAAPNGVQDVENWRRKRGIDPPAGHPDDGTVSNVLNTKSQATLPEPEVQPPMRNKFADMLADKDVSGNYDVRWK